MPGIPRISAATGPRRLFGGGAYNFFCPKCGDVTKMAKGVWGMGNGESGMRKWSAVIPKKLSWSLRSTAKRRGLHVESER